MPGNPLVSFSLSNDPCFKCFSMSGGSSRGMPLISAPSGLKRADQQNRAVQIGRHAHHMWKLAQFRIELPPVGDSLVRIFFRIIT